MRLLVRRPGLSLGEVARELGLQVSNASPVVRALVARGLLERRRDEADARVIRLRSTQRAIEIRRRREAAWGRALHARLARLSPKEVERLIDAAPALRALAAELAARE